MNSKLVYIVLVIGLASVQNASAEEYLGTNFQEYDYTDDTGLELTWIEAESGSSAREMVTIQHEPDEHHTEKNVRSSHIQSNNR
jgi:hypothetical protein